jgi:uncharacterized protein DUF1963
MSIEQQLTDLLEQVRTADQRNLTDSERQQLLKRIEELNRLEVEARQTPKPPPGYRFAQFTPYRPQFQPTLEIEQLLQKLRTAVASSELSQYADALMPLAEPCIILTQPPGTDWPDDETPVKAQQSLPLGASRLGFVPDLPRDLPWPTLDGRKYTFLAQLDLSTFPHWPGSPLPADGFLYAFVVFPDYDLFPDKPWNCNILYHPGPRDSLVRQPSPQSADEIWPDCGTLSHDLIPLTPRVGIGIDPQLAAEVLPRESLVELEDFLETSGLRDPETYASTNTAGFLLRPPDSIAGSATEQLNDLIKYGHLHPRAARLAASPSGPGDDWICLLELRSIGSMQWSDCGMLYFLIRRTDLLARNFNNVCLSMFSS